MIYASGDPSDRIYLISSGEIKISRFTPEGRELILEHVAAGSIFGESEILLGTDRESQATARTPAMVYELGRDMLMDKVRRDAKFGLWLTGQMTARQVRMENRLENLLFKTANGKVAQFLLNLARTHGKTTQQGMVIEYPITHQEIGGLIATTRETVSYAFMEFREQGLISTHKRKTIVRDLPGLGRAALN
jgi:CRP-like cAMP-binding protein